MLLYLEGEGKGKNNEISLDLSIPTLFLDNHDYNLSVKSVFINVMSSAMIEPQVFTLHTTAVDRNPFNLNQQIYEFDTMESDYIFSESKQSLDYKIQLKDFHTSQFYLRWSREFQESFFIRILLDISRDVRIQ